MATLNNGYYGRQTEKTHDAPEVATTNYPFALTPESEGLQNVGDLNGADVREFRRSGEAIVGEGSQIRTSRRSRWLWIAGVVIACLVGLGIGLGAGIAIGQNSETTTNLPKPTPDGAAHKPTPTKSSTASASPTYVTSGTTGIASFSCNSTVSDSTYTTSDITFTEQCYCDYVNGGPVWNDTSNSASKTQTFSNINQYTVYTFEDCMGQCVQWNDDIKTGSNTEKCVSVSYCANLTETVSSLMGNCFLKPARGVPSSGGGQALWASAYIADLT